jgi:two-component system, LuxR family, sensor kinase FixL
MIDSDLKKQLDSIFNTAVDGIITIDDRGHITTINPAALRLFGYEKMDDVIGKNVSFLMPAPDKERHDKYISNYQNTREKKIIGIGREVTGLRKDGSTFPFMLGVSEVKMADKVMYTGIIHDITYQKEAEEKLRRYALELERSNRELEDFAYVSSHDLQEPLRKIRAFGGLLKEENFEELSDDAKDYIDRMLNAAERMQNLISDLLDFSRISTRSKPFQKVDLNEVLGLVLSDLEIRIKETNATIKSGKLPIIEADKTQMGQLFQNLITNAIKFRKENENPLIEISCELSQKSIHISDFPGAKFYIINIKDNGIGFEQKYESKIFNIFQRLDGHKYEGSGIGLAVCKKIANRHGGDIYSQSEPGKGSTFIIKLSEKQNIKS